MKNVITILVFGFMLTAYAQDKQEQYIEEKKDSTALKRIDLKEVNVNSFFVDREIPVSVSNIKAESLKARNLGQDLPVLLNFLPSAVVTSDAGNGIGYTGIRIRGSDATRINVTINGIPYNDAESQGTFWVNLPDFTSSIDNIQVQRGVGTSANGPGAFGASINIQTEDLYKEAFTELAASAGSFNTLKNTFKFSTGLINDKIEFLGRLSKITSDGYIDRASSNLRSYFLQLNLKTNKSLFRFIGFGGYEKTYQAWFGIDPQILETNRTFNPAGQMYDENGNPNGFYNNQIDDYRQFHYQFHWNLSLLNNWNSALSINYTKGRGFFEEYHDTNGFGSSTSFEYLSLDPIQVENEVINATDNVQQKWLDNDYLVFSYTLDKKHEKYDFKLGAFFSNYDGDHFGNLVWARFFSQAEPNHQFYFGNSVKNEWSSYGKLNYKLNSRLNVYGDLQVRRVNYTSGGTGTISGLISPINIDRKFTFFNPKAGIYYTPDVQSQVYFSYSKGNREPSRSDLLNGNPVPESLNDFEFGYKHYSSSWGVHTTFYYMLYDNQLVLTGELDDVGFPLRQNSGNSYRLGVELETTWNFSAKWNWSANLTLSDNKNIDFTVERNGVLENIGNTSISYSPSLIAGSQLTYKIQKNFHAALLSKYVGEQYLSNTDSPLSQLPSYFINDLSATYSISKNKWFKKIELSLLVNNLFNVQYISNGYYYTFDDDSSGSISTIEGVGYYPQAGTNFLVGTSLSF